MKTDPGELFVLALSFFGWALLGAITFGIAYIWILPYMQATYTNVYRWLKAEYYGEAEVATDYIEEAAE